MGHSDSFPPEKRVLRLVYRSLSHRIRQEIQVMVNKVVFAIKNDFLKPREGF